MKKISKTIDLYDNTFKAFIGCILATLISIGVLIIVGMCVSFGLLTEGVFKIFKILPWVCLVATVICSICEKVLDIKIKKSIKNYLKIKVNVLLKKYSQGNHVVDVKIHKSTQNYVEYKIQLEKFADYVQIESELEEFKKMLHEKLGKNVYVNISTRS